MIMIMITIPDGGGGTRFGAIDTIYNINTIIFITINNIIIILHLHQYHHHYYYRFNLKKLKSMSSNDNTNNNTIRNQ